MSKSLFALQGTKKKSLTINRNSNTQNFRGKTLGVKMDEKQALSGNIKNGPESAWDTIYKNNTAKLKGSGKAITATK